MASGIYNVFKSNLMEGVSDLSGAVSNTVNVGLLSSTHTFTAANNLWSSVSANEIINQAGSGYTAGGATLANKHVEPGATTYFDANDTAWSSSTFTAAHAVIYDLSNSNTLICSIDFGGDKTVSAGTFTIQWDAAGVITLA